MLDVALWVLVGVCAVAAVLMLLPKPPSLDAAAFFARTCRALEGGDPGGEPLERLLGPGNTWAVFAAGGAEEALARRARELRWVGQGENLPFPEEALEGLHARLGHKSERVVVVCEGERCGPTLEALHASPELRDRLAALVLVAPRLDPELLATKVDHEQMDTELDRLTPWFFLDCAEMPAEPAVPETGRRSLAFVNLGARPNKDLDRALRLLVVAWLAS